MVKERIRVEVDAKGNVNWARGGPGIPVHQFVEKYPCKALRIIASGGFGTDLGEAILSTIGGAHKLVEFNRTHLCGEDDGILEQV